MIIGVIFRMEASGNGEEPSSCCGADLIVEGIPPAPGWFRNIPQADIVNV